MNIDFVAVTSMAENALEIANSDQKRAPFILKPLAEATLKLTEALADYRLAERQLIEERNKLRESLPGFYEDGDITMNKAACDWVDELQRESKRFRTALEEVIAFVNKDLSSHDNRWVSRRCAEALDLALAPVGLSPNTPHSSDCSMHNAPALPVGPCDCGAAKKAAADAFNGMFEPSGSEVPT